MQEAAVKAKQAYDAAVRLQLELGAVLTKADYLKGSPLCRDLENLKKDASALVHLLVGKFSVDPESRPAKPGEYPMTRNQVVAELLRHGWFCVRGGSWMRSTSSDSVLTLREAARNAGLCFSPDINYP
jgi:hypothetical protein